MTAHTEATRIYLTACYDATPSIDARSAIWDLSDTVHEGSTLDECARARAEARSILARAGVDIVARHRATAIADMRDVEEWYNDSTDDDVLAGIRDTLTLPGVNVPGGYPVDVYDPHGVAFITVLDVTA